MVTPEDNHCVPICEFTELLPCWFLLPAKGMNETQTGLNKSDTGGDMFSKGWELSCSLTALLNRRIRLRVVYRGSCGGFSCDWISSLSRDFKLQASEMRKAMMGSFWGRNPVKVVAEGRETNEVLPPSEHEELQTNETLPMSEEQEELLPVSNEIFLTSEKLIPGIPDMITLDHISTKLPWRDLCVLSSVSHAWNQANKSRQVFDARVRSNTTETFVVHNHSDDPCVHSSSIWFHLVDSINKETLSPENIRRTSLYSIRDDCCYELPIIPELHSGRKLAFRDAHIISLEGQIYVLGGNAGRKKEVYAFDLAGKKRWKRCANMQQRRSHFGCGVVGGKIYVLGGCNPSNRSPQSEVYDPKVNAWSTVMSRRTSTREVATLGEELLVYSGLAPDRRSENPEGALFLEIYHPIRDEWKTVHPFGMYRSGTVFMSQGIFYMMTKLGIYVHDSVNNSWTHLYSNSSFPRNFHEEIMKDFVMTVNDELTMGACFRGEKDHTGLLRGKGSGTENEAIVWERTKCSELCGTAMFCVIEL